MNTYQTYEPSQMRELIREKRSQDQRLALQRGLLKPI